MLIFRIHKNLCWISRYNIMKKHINKYTTLVQFMFKSKKTRKSSSCQTITQTSLFESNFFYFENVYLNIFWFIFINYFLRELSIVCHLWLIAESWSLNFKISLYFWKISRWVWEMIYIPTIWYTLATFLQSIL